MEASTLAWRAGAAGARRPRWLLLRLSDERLVDEMRAGSSGAFEALYERHHRGLLSFCRHMLGSHAEAEDALQLVFVSAYENLCAHERDVRLGPWLYTVARNRCLTMLRARRETPSELVEPSTVGLAEAAQGREDVREVLRDISGLPEEQRAALVLFELGDLPHGEIASVLDCEPARVKALVYQARSALAERRRARAVPCDRVREELATARGGALRRSLLRRHLRECAGCTAFRADVAQQRRALALALPVLPGAALRADVMAAASGGAGGAGALAHGCGAGVGAILASKVGVAKVAATVLVVAGVGTGAGMVAAPEARRPDARTGSAATVTGGVPKPSPRSASAARARSPLPSGARGRPSRPKADRGKRSQAPPEGPTGRTRRATDRRGGSARVAGPRASAGRGTSTRAPRPRAGGAKGSSGPAGVGRGGARSPGREGAAGSRGGSGTSPSPRARPPASSGSGVQRAPSGARPR